MASRTIHPRSAHTGMRLDTRCETCNVRRFTFCGALAAQELVDVEAISLQVGVAPHTTIINEGDEATYVYNVTSGAGMSFKLMSDGRRQVTGFLFPGDFIGLSARGAYAYSVDAIRPMTLCRFTRNELATLCQRHAGLEQRMFGMVTDELALAQDQMLLLGRKHARERVASFLLRLSERQAERGQAEDPVDLPMTRADIADYLGLTTETVSRTMTKMHREGLIEIAKPDRVHLKDREAVGKVAGIG